ncbi:hypothetical protein NC652_010016 [Populus alba x Populus x berolinensis]|nr:hypothetical protein NC652_010016 [Populus alba x Populus x berolinensis]
MHENDIHRSKANSKKFCPPRQYTAHPSA